MTAKEGALRGDAALEAESTLSFAGDALMAQAVNATRQAHNRDRQ